MITPVRESDPGIPGDYGKRGHDEKSDLGLDVRVSGAVLAADNPDWAYPVTPPPPQLDAVTLKSVPGSTKQYTQAQIDDIFNPRMKGVPAGLLMAIDLAPLRRGYFLGAGPAWGAFRSCASHSVAGQWAHHGMPGVTPLQQALTALADALAERPAEEILFQWFRSGRLVGELSVLMKRRHPEVQAEIDRLYQENLAKLAKKPK